MVLLRSSAERLDLVRRWALPVLLFCAFPVGLVWPTYAGFPLIFHLELPVLFWAGLIAIALFIMFSGIVEAGRVAGVVRRRMWTGIFAAAVASGTFWTVLSMLLHSPRKVEAAVVLAGMFLVPAWIALAPRRFLPSARNWRTLLIVLWGLQAAHALWQAFLHQEVVGLVGNRNWFAALMAALIPWLFPRNGSGFRSSFVRSRIVPGLALGITVFLLVPARSRAAWLALGAYMLLYGPLPGLSRGGRAVLCAGLAAVAGAAFAVWPEFFVRQWQRDIRPPMWAATARLIADHAVTGVGPGNFRREFVRYKSPAHHARPDAAPVTEHPHNEILHLAALTGLPGAVAFLVLLLPLARPSPGGPLFRSAHMTVFVLSVCGMFDKTLVRPPDALLAWLCLGLLWRRRIRMRLTPVPTPELRRRPTRAAVAVILACWGVQVGVRVIRVGWYWREAWLFESSGKARQAFAAYRKAAVSAPRDVRAQFYAGDIAIRKLHAPGEALPFLERVRRLEPDFAHTHRDLGMTWAALGDFEAALREFQEEARLFPYEPAAWRDLFATNLRVRRWSAAESAWKRFLAVAEFRRRQRLGEERLQEIGARWLLAVRRGEPREALEAARELTAGLPTGGAEQEFGALLRISGLPADLASPVFTIVDVRWWEALVAVRRKVLQRHVRTVRDLAADVAGRSSGLMQRPDVRQAGNPFAPDAGDVARQAGLEVAVAAVTPPGAEKDGNRTAAPVWVFHDGTDFWLLDGNSGVVLWSRGFPELWQAFRIAVGGRSAGGSGNAPARVRLRVRAAPLNFCFRTQLLAALVRIGAGRRGPVFGDSPTLRLAAWKALLAGDSQGEHAAVADVSAETAGFDPAPFDRLARALR